MAYDSARAVALLFGGGQFSYDFVLLGDTWEWNGNAWIFWPGGGPSRRLDHALAYDDARGVAVLFGGGVERFEPGYFFPNGETWEWDGSAWIFRALDGPSPRMGHAMAYDSARRVVVLFGGGDGFGGSSSETWEWDGSTWTLRDAVAGPSPRSQHAMAYDSARGVVVLFGGVGDCCPELLLSDTWEWDGSTWTLRATAGPSSRSGHVMAYDSTRGVAVLFGGYDGSSDGETWEWDGSTWAHRAATNLGSDNAMVFDSARNLLLLFGGGAQTWAFASASSDCNANGIPDECLMLESDCNSNSIPDDCDVAGGTSLDCGGDGTLDECQFAGVTDSIWVANNGLWSHEPNWCPRETPNNGGGDLFSVLISGPAAAATLDISPTIEALEIAGGATIEANTASGAAVRTLAVGSAIENDGTVRARDGRRLLLDASDINQTPNGVIAAIGLPGQPSKVQINGRRVTGGHIRTSGNSAAVELLGGAVLEGVIVEQNVDPDLELSQTIVVPDQQSGTLAGVIENEGRIDVNGFTDTTTLKPSVAGATLSGGGRVMLRSLSGQPQAELGADSRTLINSNGHTVEGAGTLIGLILNEGTVDANVPDQSLVVGESGRKTLGPSGVYRASNGGMLEIRKRINHPPDTAQGRLEADGGTIRLKHPKGDPIVVRCAIAHAGSNGIIELADASRLELTGPLILDSGGIYQGAAGSSAVLLADDILVGGNELGGELRLADTMSLTVGGDLSMRLTGGGCRGAPRGCTPPLLSMMAFSDMDLNGSMRMGGPVDILVVSTANVTLAGDFDNRCTTPQTFKWENGPLTLDGSAPQTFEAAGQDRGPYLAGLVDNYAMGTLTVGPGRTANIVDAFDNQQDGGSGCDEALYVNTLVVESGATFNSAGCHVYYGNLINAGSIPGLGSNVLPIFRGDCDGDGDVQLDDWANAAGCLTGPTGTASAGCECAMLDGDSDMDLFDSAAFQSAFGG